MIAAVLLAVWLAVSPALALLIGACIRHADEQPPTRSDLGLAA